MRFLVCAFCVLVFTAPQLRAQTNGDDERAIAIQQAFTEARIAQAKAELAFARAELAAVEAELAATHAHLALNEVSGQPVRVALMSQESAAAATCSSEKSEATCSLTALVSEIDREFDAVHGEPASCHSESELVAVAEIQECASEASECSGTLELVAEGSQECASKAEVVALTDTQECCSEKAEVVALTNTQECSAKADVVALTDTQECAAKADVVAITNTQECSAKADVVALADTQECSSKADVVALADTQECSAKADVVALTDTQECSAKADVVALTDTQECSAKADVVALTDTQECCSEKAEVVALTDTQECCSEKAEVVALTDTQECSAKADVVAVTDGATCSGKSEDTLAQLVAEIESEFRAVHGEPACASQVELVDVTETQECASKADTVAEAATCSSQADLTVASFDSGSTCSSNATELVAVELVTAGEGCDEDSCCEGESECTSGEASLVALVDDGDEGHCSASETTQTINASFASYTTIGCPMAQAEIATIDAERDAIRGRIAELHKELQAAKSKLLNAQGSVKTASLR